MGMHVTLMFASAMSRTSRFILHKQSTKAGYVGSWLRLRLK
jgi:hypothetical protein